MRSSSIGSPSLNAGGATLGGAGAGGDDNDEDDAPPAETLAEADGSRNDFAGTSFGEGVDAMATSPPFRKSLGGLHSSSSSSSSSLGRLQMPLNGGMSTPYSQAQSQSLQPLGQKQPAKSSLCTLLIYGFPSNVTSTVLSHFGAIGEIVSHSSISTGGTSGNDAPVVSECLRVVYGEPWHALRALRRNGELVAGTVYVGLRWADESLHQEMMINGINSPVFSSASGVSSNGLVPSAPCTVSSVPSPAPLPGTEGGRPTSVSSGAGAGARSARDWTPSFGRPINIIDSPAAALRARTAGSQGGVGSGTSSPFSKAIGGLFGPGTASSSGPGSVIGTPSKAKASAGGGAGAQGAAGGPGTSGNQSGVIGRLGDAIFGW